jgi:hypothetical protein
MGPITTVLSFLAGTGALLATEVTRRHLAGVRLEGEMRRTPATATGRPS